MGFAHRAFVAAGVGFAVSAIVGCGSSGGRWLSASESNQLSQQLNRVIVALDDQRCSEARQYLSQFQTAVQGLGGVNSTLISNLDQGASTIQSLATSQCHSQVVAPPKKTHPKTRTSTTTTTTATQTTPTFTTPTTTTYTQPTYTTPTDTQPSTNTTGGTCPSCSTTTTTSTTTASTTPSTTTPSGGTGLGGTDTSTSATSTSSSAGGSGGGY